MGAILALLALVGVAATIAFYGLIVWDRLKEKKSHHSEQLSDGDENN